MTATAPNVDVIIGGKEISDSDLVSHSIERDMFQPDMANIVITNQNDAYGSVFKIGDPVEIKVGDPAKSVYKGEITGIQTQYKGGDTAKLTIVSMNKMHKLLRSRKSLTFQDKNDQQIFQAVLQGSGLTLDWKGPTIQYKHVYQHNLSDLEFIRMRASRIGCHVWCVDTTLHIKQPDFSKTNATKLSVDKDGTLRNFSPHMSSASVAKKVTVKGWDPEKKELITATANAKPSPLGPTNAPTACGPLVSEENFTVDQPVWSKQEAQAIADAKLLDGNLQYITGTAEIRGGSDFDLAEVVDITANANGADMYNGKYYIMGLSHRHTLPKKSDGGYITTLKIVRDAQGV